MSGNPDYQFPEVLVRVDVTHADIETGLRGDPHKCAIAKALERFFASPRTEVTVTVGNQIATVHMRFGDYSTKMYEARLHPEMLMFMEAFDHRRDVRPQTFDFRFTQVDERKYMSILPSFLPKHYQGLGIDWAYSNFKPSKKQELFLMGV